MASIAELNARLEKLKKALGSGVLTVRHGDTQVTYRSIAELRTAVGAVEQDIAAAGGSQLIRSFKLTSSKDL